MNNREDKREKAEKLQDAIGLVNEEYVAEAHEEANGAASGSKVVQIPARTRRKKLIGGIVAAAACLALTAGVLLTQGLRRDGMSEGVTEHTHTYSADEADSESEMTESAPGASAGAETEEATEGPALDEAAPLTDGYVEDGAMYDSESSAAMDSGSAKSEEYAPAAGDVEWDEDCYYPEYQEGEAFVLTAGVWNDNENWPFFRNLLRSGTISFPAFGIDPVNRIPVTAVDENGRPLTDETVELLDRKGRVIWSAKTDQEGKAYLFESREGQGAYVAVNGAEEEVIREVLDYDQSADYLQDEDIYGNVEEVRITAPKKAKEPRMLQVMFIIDTTGSMSDEIAYLQKDFASIAKAAGNNGISYSVNFYRDKGDEYVTKCFGFNDSVSDVQSKLNAEYADGGGDEPEAVADILDECITENDEWRDDCRKVAFLIFDAPPHEGHEQELQAAVKAAAKKGIHLIPVVASNASRETELFGRALSICTNSDYVFLTDDSGVGNSHLEPIVGDYDVELLHDIIVREILKYQP